jgi:nitronate monooxygenase
MSLRTSFTECFSLRHPVALAPMGRVAGGALAAAVSNGGGLGLIGGGGGDKGWLQDQLRIVTDSMSDPWGVGFLSWALETETLEWTLQHRPPAIMLSFGDPRPFADVIRDAGAKLIVQVTDLDEARRATEFGPT